jgi:very-short-patch-repair endonuclease
MRDHAIKFKSPLSPEFLARIRVLRQHATDAEKLMWKLLRNRQLGGVKFRRQHPVGKYILDFYSYEFGLAVELDGGGPANPSQMRYDVERTQALEEQGIRVLRFWNNEVLCNTEGVLQSIWEAVNEGVHR